MKTTTLALLGAIAAVPLLGIVAVRSLDAQEAVVSSPETVPVTDRAATEAIIREYLLANPDVIIEAIERWQDLQALAADTQMEDGARANLSAMMAADTGVPLGASVAETEVLVVEFFDYHCGYCRRATDFVMELTEDDGIRVVLQDLPILRTESRGAALAGLAAAEVGAYTAMHQQLMRTGGVLGDDAIAKAAKRARADGALDLLADPDAKARLEARLTGSVDIARSMGLDGTPSFLIASPDGAVIRLIPGFDQDAVRRAIQDVRDA